MTAKRKPTQPDPREALLQARPGPHKGAPPAAVLDDLRWFRKQLDDTGSTVSLAGMLEFFETKRKFRIGLKRLYTIARQHGITPWWKP